jgi:hypothetical protein
VYTNPFDSRPTFGEFLDEGIALCGQAELVFIVSAGQTNLFEFRCTLTHLIPDQLLVNSCIKLWLGSMQLEHDLLNRFKELNILILLVKNNGNISTPTYMGVFNIL